MSPGDQTIAIDDALGLPDFGALWIAGELVHYAGKSDELLTGVTRGVAGTTPQAHATGVKAVLVVSECTGDCNADFEIKVSELVFGVRVALDQAPIVECLLLDDDQNERATVNELISGVSYALKGCPLPSILP